MFERLINIKFDECLVTDIMKLFRPSKRKGQARHLCSDQHLKRVGDHLGESQPLTPQSSVIELGCELIDPEGSYFTP